jgi:hypothetical protein
MKMKRIQSWKIARMKNQKMNQLPNKKLLIFRTMIMIKRCTWSMERRKKKKKICKKRSSEMKLLSLI